MIKLNGNEVIFKKFPNGETLIDKDQIDRGIIEDNRIVFKYEDDSDLIKLMFIKKHLDTLGTISDLILVYCPYSRMDRSESGSVFTLKYVAKFINFLQFADVQIIEPHSDVTMALIDNVFPINLSLKLFNEMVGTVKFDKERDCVYFPDASAEKRYSKHLKGYKTLTGFKKRDFKTGEIQSLEIFGEPDSKGFNVIMIDDLCSRGGTFMYGGKKLKEMGADKIYLVVAHCEDTIFTGDIFKTDIIDTVYTTNSILDLDHNGEYIKIKEII
ncbi:ribose-phosphate pyrophosphokinase [Candidatus Pacearchaeota archaeon]|nr:ribose-phosphate pyrophosphokinase [Candidatus Pacearchaeota archaeon]